jgi:hypothetical protein
MTEMLTAMNQMARNKSRLTKSADGERSEQARVDLRRTPPPRKDIVSDRKEKRISPRARD